MISYFVSAGILIIGLSMVRIACPEKQAGRVEVFIYRAAIAWFVLLTMIHINFFAGLIYGLLFPWIGHKAIDAFPWQWFGERERIIGWLLVLFGALGLLLTARYTSW
jgi:hypothetical protein